MTDLADRLDHAFLPYIAHTHTAQIMSGADAGITSPTATNPREAA